MAAVAVRRSGAQRMRLCSQQWRARSNPLFVPELTEMVGQPRDVGLPLFGEGELRKAQDKKKKKDLGAVVPLHMGQFYQRSLPPAQVPFSSEEGRKLFKEALADGTMENYFFLAEQFRTQDEPTFCGLTTLAMVLNSLRIDPMQTWKGAWRWISEDMLSCCSAGSPERVREEGVSFDVFRNLALCQGAHVQAHRAPPAPTSMEVAEYEAVFRAEVARVCRSQQRECLVISYSRQSLGQTGAGHFSPIGGYHAGTDSVLILDVARFKYPPHWAPVSEIAEAMLRIDKSTERPRGFMTLQLPETQTASQAAGSGMPLTAHWLPPAAGRKLSEVISEALHAQCWGHPDEPMPMVAMRRWLHAASLAEPQVLRKLLQVGKASALNEVFERLQAYPVYKELLSAYGALVSSEEGFKDTFPPLRSSTDFDSSFDFGAQDDLALAQLGELWVLLLLLLPHHLRFAVSPELAALPIQKDISRTVRGPWALPLEVLRETLAHLIPPLHADACSTVLH